MYNKLALICFVMSAILSLPVISSRSESEEVTRFIEIHPTLLTSSDPNYIFGDFNEVFFGKLKIVTNDLSMNQNLTIRLGEDCSNGRVNMSPPTPRVRALEIHLLVNASSVTTENLAGAADERRMTQSIGQVMPYRCVEISGWRGDIQRHNVIMLAAISSDFVAEGNVEVEGAGEGAEAPLMSIWNLSSHTIKATSYAGLFVDGDRERRPYEADAYINQLGWYSVVGNDAIVSRTFDYLVSNPTWPTEWQSHMVMIAYEQYLHTGETGLLRKHYDRLKFLTLMDIISKETWLASTVDPPLTERFVNESLVGQSIKDNVDWPMGERDGYEMVAVNTVVDAFVYKALTTMSKVARLLNHEEDCAHFNKLAVNLHASMERLLVDPSTGLFVDGLGSSHSSAHSSFIPLAFGLVPKDRMAATLTHLQSRIAAYDGGFPCSVYGAQYLLQALFENGGDKDAYELIVNPTSRGWINMLRHNATITYEAWDDMYKPNEDWNHAWGAATANIIPRYLIGVRDNEVSWSTWSFSPSASFIRSLSATCTATVPTPKGLIKVKFHHTADRKAVHISLVVPDGTVCKVGPVAGFRRESPHSRNDNNTLLGGHHSIFLVDSSEEELYTTVE